MIFVSSFFSLMAQQLELKMRCAVRKINGSINLQNQKFNLRLYPGYTPVRKRFASALVQFCFLIATALLIIFKIFVSNSFATAQM